MWEYIDTDTSPCQAVRGTVAREALSNDQSIIPSRVYVEPLCSSMVMSMMPSVFRHHPIVPVCRYKSFLLPSSRDLSKQVCHSPATKALHLVHHLPQSCSSSSSTPASCMAAPSTAFHKTQLQDVLQTLSLRTQKMLVASNSEFLS